MAKEAFAPWKRGFDFSEGYLQGCGSAWTHESSCCTAATASSDQDYICPGPSSKGVKDYRGYDWFKQGVPDFSTNGTNSALLIRAAATQFLKDRAKTSDGSPFFMYLPFQNIHAPYTAMAEYVALYDDRSDLTAEEKVMFGYVSEMDAAVGTVVEAVKETGFWNSTL